MNIKITSIHFKMSKVLESFVNEKVAKLGRYHDGIISAEVILKLENTEKADNKIAEISLHIKNNDVMAAKQGKSFEEATDLAIDALKTQISRTKAKERDHKGNATLE